MAEIERFGRPHPLWAPLVPLYAVAVVARRWAYDRGLLRVERPAVFTVSVGGLEAGGSGKTPVAGLVLRSLLAAGRRPALLTRGYGRPQHDLRVRGLGEPALPNAIGDEPAMLVAGGIDVPVAASPSRRRGARALSSHDIDAFVLDDGFQHRALGRHLDIVVLRGEAPFGNGHLLPWGTLREPPSSLHRAHLVWLHYRGNAVAEEPSWRRRLCPAAALVVSEAVPTPPRDGAGELVPLAGRRVAAAAGIARPEDFRASLQRLGAKVMAFVGFADHHRYTEADARVLAELVVAERVEALVVTTKDHPKLAPLWSGPPLWVVGSEPRIRMGADTLARALGVPSLATT